MGSILRPVSDILHNTLKNKAFYALIALAVFLSPDLAYADPNTLGQMMCSISFNLAPFERLLVGLSYITGSILVGMGLSQLAYFSDTFNAGKQYGIARPKGLLVAGASMLALPSFLHLMVNSLFDQSFNADLGGGLSGCVAYVGAAGVGGQVGLDGLMTNVVMNIKSPMIFMLSVISILIGIFLVIKGLLKGSKFGQDAKSSLPNIFANLIIGTILYTVGTSMNTIMATVFGDSTIGGPGGVVSAVAANFGANTQPFQAAVYAALTFFQMVGMIAFIRGWLILKDSVENGGGQQNKVAQGLTHIVGGVLAVNIYRFLEAMDASFGTGFLS